MTKLKQKKTLKRHLLILSLFLVSCAGIKDKPVCADVTIERGKCVFIVSGKVQNIDDENLLDGKTWFEIKGSSLVLPLETWAEIKAFIKKACRKYKCEDDLGVIEKVDGLNGR